MSLPHESRKSIEAMYQRAAQEAATEPDANPDGRYWQLGVQALQGQLTEMIGRENYEAFADIVWPDTEIDKLTWKQIYEQLNRALDLAWQGQRDVAKLADAAEYPEGSAPGCYGLPD